MDSQKENYIAKIENDIHYLNGTIKKNKDCIPVGGRSNNKNQIISNLRKELYDIQSSSAWKLIKPSIKVKMR